MTVRVEINPSDIDMPGLLVLLRASFAYMADRIDPPSSLTRMTLADLQTKAKAEDLYVICEGTTPIACLFGAAQGDVYYVGKLAVAETHRGKGLARTLIEAAAAQAIALGHPKLELQSRVELVENHAAFSRMGFLKTAETAHEGYTRPTSYTFQRSLPVPLSSPRSAGGL